MPLDIVVLVITIGCPVTVVLVALSRILLGWNNHSREQIMEAENILKESGITFQRTKRRGRVLLAFDSYELTFHSDHLFIKDTRTFPFQGIAFNPRRFSPHLNQAKTIATGDPKFDQIYHLQLSRPALLALFTQDMRSEIIRTSASLSDMTLNAGTNGKNLRWILSFLERLNAPQIQAAMAALEDPCPAFRAAVLDLLTAHEPNTPEFLKWLEAHNQTDTLILLKIAVHQNKADGAFLLNLINAPRISEPTISAVMVHLARCPELDPRDIIQQLLSREDVPDATIISALEIGFKDLEIDLHFAAKLLPPLAKRYQHSEKQDHRIQILNLMGHLPGPKTRAFLIQRLQLDLDVSLNWDLPRALCEQLAVMGTAEEIPPLWRAGESTNHPFVKKALTEAITRIQSRLGPVEAGMLSTPATPADPEGGLSRVPDQAGGLSHDPDQSAP